MTLSPLARGVLRALLFLVLAFMYIPLLLVLLNSFNPNEVASWPPQGFSLVWWDAALESSGARNALIESLHVAAWATAIALVLGSMIAFAIAGTSGSGVSRSRC